MSIVYGSSVEALHDLLSSHRVTEISTDLCQLTNGIEYVFVEITCDDGSQYGLQAYGKEAIDLHRRALEISKKIIPHIAVLS
jgi:hypothetical protein